MQKNLLNNLCKSWWIYIYYCNGEEGMTLYNSMKGGMNLKRSRTVDLNSESEKIKKIVHPSIVYIVNVIFKYDCL